MRSNLNNTAHVLAFAALFSGRNDAYGTGNGQWIRKQPQRTDYLKHLEGRGPGLGIAPLLDDGTVLFAAIDLDEPDFKAAREMQEFLSFGGAYIERSRSGNAHIWCFFSEPIEAWVVRGILREATAAIGKPAVEVFPKQDKLLPGMVGNYINLPYHGDMRPILCAPDYKTAMPLEQFLINVKLNNPADWRKRAEWLMIAPPSQRNGDKHEFGTAKELHICAEWIIANRDENPVREGHRNVVYFNLAKQLCHYEGFDRDEVWDLLCSVRDSADEQGIDHVPDSELRRILSNVERGEFTGTGCDDPLFSPYAHPDCKIAKDIR